MIAIPSECLPPEPTADNPDAIVREVAARWGVAVKTIRGRSRQRRVSLARRACIVALRHLCPNLSLADIGAQVGGIDHTSVLYALERAGVKRTSGAGGGSL